MSTERKETKTRELPEELKYWFVQYSIDNKGHEIDIANKLYKLAINYGYLYEYDKDGCYVSLEPFKSDEIRRYHYAKMMYPEYTILYQPDKDTIGLFGTSLDLFKGVLEEEIDSETITFENPYLVDSKRIYREIYDNDMGLQNFIFFKDGNCHCDLTSEPTKCQPLRFYDAAVDLKSSTVKKNYLFCNEEGYEAYSVDASHLSDKLDLPKLHIHAGYGKLITQLRLNEHQRERLSPLDQEYLCFDLTSEHYQSEISDIFPVVHDEDWQRIFLN